nr:PREDICTED: uncharacterized protein LOC105663160 [Megachile rotundata]
MWYMQDGAPPHSTISVREHLSTHFQNRWIGRGAPIPGPARSPDLNPMDFHFWGHMKTITYSTHVNSIEELEQRIEFSAVIVKNVMTNFEKMRQSLLLRIQLCLEENGGYFERLL